MTLVGARLKSSVQSRPSLRGMYQRGTCKGCDNNSTCDLHFCLTIMGISGDGGYFMTWL